MRNFCTRDWPGFAALAVNGALACCVALTLQPEATAQQFSAAQTSAAAPGTQDNAGTTPTPSDSITEDSLKQQFAGKTLYLRGGYLDNSLSFDEHGSLIGHSPQGSYTLSLVQIDKVSLTKRKVELEGARYGLHFLGALPNEDALNAVDKVRITPKKKVVRITIDRELVVSPKKKKAKDDAKLPAAEGDGSGMPAALEAKGSGTEKSLTTTTSPAHAAQLLKDALAQVFAQGLDAQMIAAMPDFWKLYYQSAAAHTDFRPNEPGVYLQNAVDQKAKLLSNIEPPSNDFAQSNSVAGMALYHAVIGPDGKPQEIVVGRPIGFGLDENAVETIKKVSFQPAIKDGKPVPVLIDLVVQFRIYSKRTEQPGTPEMADKPAGPPLPGPYSLTH
jgi:TonB family protein